MKLLIVEPRKVQFLLLVVEDGRPVFRGTTDRSTEIEELVISHGIRSEHIIIINTEPDGSEVRALCAALGAKSVRLSTTWATGTSFGYPRPDTYINIDGFEGGDLCEWVARRYYSWLLGEMKRRKILERTSL